jgi:hypothetical protein
MVVDFQRKGQQDATFMVLRPWISPLHSRSPYFWSWGDFGGTFVITRVNPSWGS